MAAARGQSHTSESANHSAPCSIAYRLGIPPLYPGAPEKAVAMLQHRSGNAFERDGDRVRLITRGGYDWTKRYPWIAGNKLPQSNVKQRNTVLPGGRGMFYFDGRRR
jgi:hypothetical protein